MSGNKTVPTNVSVPDFLKGIEDPVQQKDSCLLVELMEAIAAESPVMWGPAIVGFGSYHYKYESGREGDMLKIGFSPRKGKLALYVGALSGRNRPLRDQLGKYTHGKSCLYVKRLEDININVLREIITNTGPRRQRTGGRGPSDANSSSSAFTRTGSRTFGPCPEPSSTASRPPVRRATSRPSASGRIASSEPWMTSTGQRTRRQRSAAASGVGHDVGSHSVRMSVSGSVSRPQETNSSIGRVEWGSLNIRPAKNSSQPG